MGFQLKIIQMLLERHESLGVEYPFPRASGMSGSVNGACYMRVSLSGLLFVALRQMCVGPPPRLHRIDIHLLIRTTNKNNRATHNLPQRSGRGEKKKRKNQKKKFSQSRLSTYFKYKISLAPFPSPKKLTSYETACSEALQRQCPNSIAPKSVSTMPSTPSFL